MKTKLIIVLFCLTLFSCGLDAVFYLPQVSQGLITTDGFSIDANIIIPSISNYDYARHYSIYYKIYISEQDTPNEIITYEQRNSISPTLAGDFEVIFPSTDPPDETTTSDNLFSSRNYFELELVGANIKNLLSKSSGTQSLRLSFSTNHQVPVAIFNNDGNEIPLSRSKRGKQGTINNLEPDQFFLNTSELNDRIDTASNTNIDVARGRTVSPSPQFAYVSMYIVAVGQDPTSLASIYSKPTHISIFRLPDAN